MEVTQEVIAAYEKRIADLEGEMKTRVPMILSFQGTIDQPPVSREQMFAQSCSNDATTINHWKDIWLKHIKINNERHNFHENSVMKDFGKYACRPVIVAGSGPSLKKNAHLLKDHKPPEMGLVSCLHNFAYFVDLGVPCDGFVNLDAGDITIPEVVQGGTKPADYDWDATKDYTLVAASVSHPGLIEKWKGRILWFSAPVPDPLFMTAMSSITDFEVFYNVGGNALGASYYHARGTLGGTPVAMIGADFSFDYMRKFHPFSTPYDQQFAGVIPMTDIFGNRVFTWPSYANFANWFIHQSMGGNGNNPTMIINCTEGGVLGSFPNGNIASIKQMALIDFLAMYSHYKMMPDMITKDPSKPKLLF